MRSKEQTLLPIYSKSLIGYEVWISPLRFANLILDSTAKRSIPTRAAGETFDFSLPSLSFLDLETLPSFILFSELDDHTEPQLLLLFLSSLTSHLDIARLLN